MTSTFTPANVCLVADTTDLRHVMMGEFGAPKRTTSLAPLLNLLAGTTNGSEGSAGGGTPVPVSSRNTVSSHNTVFCQPVSRSDARADLRVFELTRGYR